MRLRALLVLASGLVVLAASVVAVDLSRGGQAVGPSVVLLSIQDLGTAGVLNAPPARYLPHILERVGIGLSDCKLGGIHFGVVATSYAEHIGRAPRPEWRTITCVGRGDTWTADSFARKGIVPGDGPRSALPTQLEVDVVSAGHMSHLLGCVVTRYFWSRAHGASVHCLHAGSTSCATAPFDYFLFASATLSANCGFRSAAP